MGAVTAGWCGQPARATAAGATLALHEPFVGFELWAMSLDVFANIRIRSPTGLARGQGSSKQPAAQRTPRNEADPISLAGRNHLELNGSFEEIVKALFRNESEKMA